MHIDQYIHSFLCISIHYKYLYTIYIHPVNIRFIYKLVIAHMFTDGYRENLSSANSSIW